MNETLDEQSRWSLVRYRIERADETIDEAKLLASDGHFNAAMSRLYYACFYAASALLVAHGISTSSHAGVKTMLSLHFVSKDLLAKEHGKIPALTECGMKNLTEPTWWTSTLLPTVEGYPISYLLVWRNYKGEWFGPSPSKPDADYFRQMYDNEKILFLKEIAE